MPITCPQCGAQNADSAAACYSCGRALSSYAPSPGSGYAQPQNQYNQQNPYSSAPAYGQQGYSGQGTPYAGTYADPVKRLLAFIIDGLIVGAALIPGYILVFAGAAAEEPVISIFGILVLAVLGLGVFGYNIYLLGRGASIGKKVMKLKCLGADGQPLGFGKALGRELLKAFIGQFCFLTHLWLLFDQEKQQLYDKALSTHVYSE